MKHIIYIVIGVVVFSCGGIPKYKDNNLKPITNVKQIEGEYKNFDNDTLEWHQNSLNGKINWRSKHEDTTHFTSVKFKILNDDRLKLDFLVDQEVMKSRIIKYRLRNNGFIKLRNRNFRISGIPLVFGEYDIMKYELGLTQTNNLILHGYNEQVGGILIVLSGGRSYVVNQSFDRIR